tara:strand:+ start:160 stop:1545 length:1386 start_codon:yes stop_codon:yes gene_type:complete
MALFSKADLPKSKYIISIVAKIKKGTKIKVKDGKSYSFKKTKDIDMLEKVQSNFQKYSKILYPNNRYAPIFVDGKNYFTFTDIDKAPFSGMGGQSRNALGKKLADAGELATVMSLRKNIENAKDTGQSIFKDNPDAFADWYNTFQYTRPAVKKIVGSLNNFDIIHDATDKSNFGTTIKAFLNKANISKQDSWNPADVYIISKNARVKIINDLKKIIDTYSVSDGLINMFNDKLYKLYKKKVLYPISLKQLISEKANVDYTNVPGQTKVSDYDIEIAKFNCNLTPEGKEIGLFTFNNKDTKKQINLQVRGFPHGYGTAQTEITSDGTPTGGRLGKIPTKVVDSVMSQYKDARISSIRYFGAGKPFSDFDENKCKETYKMYETVIKDSKVFNEKKLSYKEFVKIIDVAKANMDVAENMVMKIQGLKIMCFFIKNKKDLSSIMNKMINGAKKIDDSNGFFIKIY